MVTVNIHEVKAKLSYFIQLAQSGERVIICNRNIPVAEIKPMNSTKTGKRPLGLAKGEITFPKEWFEPLDQEIIDSMNNRPPFPQAA